MQLFKRAERMEPITVECYAGSKAEEIPLRFFIEKRCVEITSIKNRWLTPEGWCFKIIGNDGVIYVLHYKLAEDKWSIPTIDRP